MNRKSEIPGYRSWTSMLERCRNPNRHNYKRYIERGISVCDRWLSFDNFLQDMGPRPEGRTLDRIDNDKGYSPDNCRWATLEEQNFNRGPFAKRGTHCFKDRAGQKYNNLTFVSFSHSDGKRSYWTMACDCGAHKKLDANDVVRGHTKSCGCLRWKRKSPGDGQTTPCPCEHKASEFQ